MSTVYERDEPILDTILNYIRSDFCSLEMSRVHNILKYGLDQFYTGFEKIESKEIDVSRTDLSGDQKYPLILLLEQFKRENAILLL